MSRSANKAGLLALTAIVYFTVSGGAFGLEELVGTAGPAIAMTLILALPLLWSLPTALMVAELSAALPVEGGYYRWVDRALGRFWGFQEAWWSWAASLPDMALYPVLFAGYLGESFHLSPAQRWMVALLVVWTCALLNLFGIRIVGRTAIVAGALVILPFLIFSAWGLATPVIATTGTTPQSPGPIDWSFHSIGPGLLLGLSIALWNYTGWDNVSLVGGEVERPDRNYPRSLGLGLLLVIALYVFPVMAGLRVAPHSSAWKEGSFPLLAQALPIPHAGPALYRNWLGGWLLVGALASSWTLFNSQLLSYSRLPLVLAEDGYLPRRLARVDRRGVPAGAVLVSAALYSLFALLGFGKLIVLDALLYTLSLVLEFLALWRLRQREPELPRPFRVPGGNLGLVLVVAPPLGIATTLLAFTCWNGLADRAWLALSLALAVAGGPLFWFLKRRLEA